MRIVSKCVLLLAVYLGTVAYAQDTPAPTPGVLTILYETDNPGGKYGNLNVQAVWVEKADGSFVQTLDSWGKEHAKQLKQWTAADKKWKLHARTGATLMAYGPFITRWNATDASGHVIPDDDYIIRLELTNDNANKNKFSRASIPFVKSTQPVTIGALSEGGYKQILLSWRPCGTDQPLPKSTASPIQKEPNMILDELNKTLSHGELNPRIMKGLELLRDKSVLSAPLGKHEVDGTNLYYIVDEYQTKPWEQGRPEIHQKYLDIQYIISGTECIGFCPLEGLAVDTPYDPQKDIAYYKYAPGMTKLVLKPGMLAIFWPNEAHMPSRQLEQPQTVRKIVIKVKMD